MPTELVAIERHAAITVIRLNRPPANAIDIELGRHFQSAFETAMAKHPAALVLTGAGRFFSGGLDLKAVPTYAASEQREMLRTLNRFVAALYACPIPVVGAVNGHAIAGGLVLALTTDYRIGPSGDALFGLTEARVGIPFPSAPMIVVQAELAPSDVRHATLYARNFGPEEARRRGVFDELQPAGGVLERALEVARDLASMPADGYRRIKQQFRRAAIEQLERVASSDADPLLEGWLSPDALQASAAILGGSRDS